MGRVYDDIKINGAHLHVIFDPGALSSYVTQKGHKKAKLKLFSLMKPRKTGLGGKKRTIDTFCDVQGKIQRFFIDIRAYLVDELGSDERGQDIDLLFGALDMQKWNIQLDVEKEALDLSRFRKEFIEF